MSKKREATQKKSHPDKVKQSKDNFITRQTVTIFEYWYNNIATASMASKATGIPQKNICRYKRDLEKAGLLFEIKKATCAHTGFRAWYITTNKQLAETLKRVDEAYRQKGGNNDRF
jgi:hypothetical protein